MRHKLLNSRDNQGGEEEPGVFMDVSPEDLSRDELLNLVAAMSDEVMALRSANDYYRSLLTGALH